MDPDEFQRLHSVDPAAERRRSPKGFNGGVSPYVTSPAVFPRVGSPNPMLTGIALARRTADRLARDVLVKAPIIAAGSGCGRCSMALSSPRSCGGRHGLWKNRTGAIYKIPTGDRIWHPNRNEDAWQQYDPSGPQLIEGVWFEFEINVRGNVFKVNLKNTQTDESRQVTRYENTDAARGQSPGFIGIQAYPGSVVAYRHIQVHD